MSPNLEEAIDPNLQSIVDDVERLTNLIVRASATKDYAIGSDLDALREDISAAILNIRGICDEICRKARQSNGTNNQ